MRVVFVFCHGEPIVDDDGDASTPRKLDFLRVAGGPAAFRRLFRAPPPPPPPTPRHVPLLPLLNTLPPLPSYAPKDCADDENGNPRPPPAPAPAPSHSDTKVPSRDPAALRGETSPPLEPGPPGPAPAPAGTGSMKDSHEERVAGTPKTQPKRESGAPVGTALARVRALYAAW